MFYRLGGVYHTRYQTDLHVLHYRFDRVQVGLILLAALTAPLWLSHIYLMGYILPWVIWGTAALSLNLLMGWAGQIHLGYAAVMAIGAYTAVHLGNAGVPLELALLGAGLAAAVIGLIFGAAALRVKGLYLAVSTLALQFLVQWIIVHVPAIGGGYAGAVQAPQVRLLGMEVTSDTGAYYMALAWCVIVTLFMVNLQRASFGRALIALREKDYAAEMIGINTFYYKIMAFWSSSFLGGVTGAVLAVSYYRAVTVEQFSVDASIQVLAMVIIGGLGNIVGSFMGAGFILLAPSIINQVVSGISGALGFTMQIAWLTNIQLMTYGALIVVFLLLEPLGLAKIYFNIRNYFLVWPFGYVKRQV
ncbi:MAG: branched-chain amino acid ABC transporter permease [Deltaproteobacteria bacterium]|nr:branched-chain amino acid ABC transporter permease [Deltaproteobacteria bacterium]